MSPRPFSSVVDEHGPMVLRFCRSMLPSADAEDAWSDTFLAALRAYPALAEDANLAAWLLTIARRKAIDIVRRRERSAVPTGTANETADRSSTTSDRPGIPAAEGAEPWSEAIDDELLVALAALSDRQRTAVVCHHVLGFTHREIAEVLGSSPEAARRSAADGVAKLRSIYPRERP